MQLGSHGASPAKPQFGMFRSERKKSLSNAAKEYIDLIPRHLLRPNNLLLSKSELDKITTDNVNDYLKTCLQNPKLCSPEEVGRYVDKVLAKDASQYFAHPQPRHSDISEAWNNFQAGPVEDLFQKYPPIEACGDGNVSYPTLPSPQASSDYSGTTYNQQSPYVHAGSHTGLPNIFEYQSSDDMFYMLGDTNRMRSSNRSASPCPSISSDGSRESFLLKNLPNEPETCENGAIRLNNIRKGSNLKRYSEKNLTQYFERKWNKQTPTANIVASSATLSPSQTEFATIDAPYGYTVPGKPRKRPPKKQLTEARSNSGRLKRTPQQNKDRKEIQKKKYAYKAYEDLGNQYRKLPENEKAGFRWRDIRGHEHTGKPMLRFFLKEGYGNLPKTPPGEPSREPPQIPQGGAAHKKYKQKTATKRELPTTQEPVFLPKNSEVSDKREKTYELSGYCC